MALSLKGKVILLFTIPTILAGVHTGNQVFQDWKVSQAADTAIGALDELNGLSALIHNLQKERGASIRFLSRASASTLVEERKDTDRALESLRSGQRPEQVKEALQRLRSLVDGQGTPQNALSQYSQLVRSLIEKEKNLVSGIDSPELARAVKSISMLESAKENTGVLRALISGILEADRPIPAATLLTIITLKGSLQGELASPGLDLTSESKAKLEQGFDSNGWKSIEATILKVVQRGEIGNYGESSQAYFDAITAFMGRTNEILLEQIATTRSAAAESMLAARQRLLVFGLGALLFLALIIGIGFTVTRKLLTSLMQVSRGLLETNQYLDSEASRLSAYSAELVDAATRASAGLHDTAASAEEVNAMVMRASEQADTAKSDGEVTASVAGQGVETADSMSHASAELARMNETMIEGINGGNRKLEQITSLFKEIEDKTKMINDIVFQTKLLSFNASVEAARAGEHGKGFSVVAEEIGNLAKVSGTSAREIDQLLKNASVEVSSIIDGTRVSTMRMSAEVKEKTEVLLQCVRSSTESFRAISESVQRVSTTVTQISSSSGEQVKAVGNINSAVTQVGRLGDSTLEIAKNVSVATTNFRSQVSYLRTVVRSLSALLSGGNGALDDGDTDDRKVTEFVWSQDLRIGVAEMDAEHEILVDKINELVRSLNSGSGVSEIKKRFAALGAYVIEHFRDEEDLMRRVGYPELDGHRKVHERLLNQVGEFQRALEIGALDKHDLITFLSDWLVSHIRSTDMKYVQYCRPDSKASRAA